MQNIRDAGWQRLTVIEMRDGGANQSERLGGIAYFEVFPTSYSWKIVL